MVLLVKQITNKHARPPFPDSFIADRFAWPVVVVAVGRPADYAGPIGIGHVIRQRLGFVDALGIRPFAGALRCCEVLRGKCLVLRNSLE